MAIKRRKRIKQIKRVDPLGGIESFLANGSQVADKKNSSLSKDMSSIYKSLQETQKQLGSVWQTAAQTVSGGDSTTENSDESAQQFKEDQASMEQMIAQEKHLSEKKVDAVAAHANAIHATLIATQQQLQKVWTKAEEVAAQAKAATGTANAPPSSNDAPDTTPPKDDSHTITEPQPHNNADVAPKT